MKNLKCIIYIGIAGIFTASTYKCVQLILKMPHLKCVVTGD